MYNNGFPIGYPQQQYVNPYQQTMQIQQQMTPPTIRAEIVQIKSREEALNFPVGPGQTQMMIMQDDSAIFFKSASVNGQIGFDEYIRKPRETVPTPADYITRDEFEQRLAAFTQTQNPVKTMEEKKDEPV